MVVVEEVEEEVEVVSWKVGVDVEEEAKEVGVVVDVAMTAEGEEDGDHQWLVVGEEVEEDLRLAAAMVVVMMMLILVSRFQIFFYLFLIYNVKGEKQEDLKERKRT